MKSLLILPKIEVENANAIAGLTYGFPGICNFTGFTHALSRELKDMGVELGGCAVVCHRFKVHAHEVGVYKSFSQSRFPLDKYGETQPIIQEGKMHMTVSLIISCNFIVEDFYKKTKKKVNEFEKFIHETVYKKTMAGGFIKHLKPPQFIEINSKNFSLKKELRKLMPGFLIKDQSDDFKKYLESEDKNDPLTSWLDCFTIRHKSQKSFANGVEKCDWSVEKKPLPGWIVPVQIGYKSLSKVFAAGEVKYSRDISTPFCFVEPIYSIAGWISLYRVEDIEDLKSFIWDFCTTKNYYYCKTKKF